MAAKMTSGRFLEKDERLQLIKNMYNTFEFNNKLWILGCGALGTSTTKLLLKIVRLDPKNITIFDMRNVKEKIDKYLDPSINFINVKIGDMVYLEYTEQLAISVTK